MPLEACAIRRLSLTQQVLRTGIQVERRPITKDRKHLANLFEAVGDEEIRSTPVAFAPQNVKIRLWQSDRLWQRLTKFSQPLRGETWRKL